MSSSMWHAGLLLVLVCCATAVSANCICKPRAPTNVRFVAAGVSINRDRDTEYYGTGTSVSLQYVNGTAKLSWQAYLERDIGDDLKVQLTVRRMTGKGCFNEVIRTDTESFCNSSSTTAAYVKLFGLHDSHPPVRCPLKKTKYALCNFTPKKETLSPDIFFGEQLVELSYYVGNTVVIADSLHMIAT